MQSLTLILCLLARSCASMVGCRTAASLKPTPTTLASCGNGICDNGESTTSCPLDCPPAGFSGRIHTTFVNSAGVGDIAIMIAEPKAARYPEGAGVVVVVSPIFSQAGG